MILDPGFNLTLRPMKYPIFYEMYKNGIKNTWTVEEIDFSRDINDLRSKMSPAERHLINRLVAFFATGDSIVGNNLVLNLYKHINSPEARLYLSRQLYEEALHVQFYLTLLDSYIPDVNERAKAFSAIDNIPSIQKKAQFCFKWMDSINKMDRIETVEDRRKFLMNLTCFATCIEGLFFFGAFAYVYFLRSKGLLDGLASGTNWVFRDESAHMTFAFEVIEIARKEDPTIFTPQMNDMVTQMISEAVECEMAFADDVLDLGIAGLSKKDMREYLQYIADQRLEALHIPAKYHSKMPFSFMELQDVQELTNFFERKVAAYQVGVSGDVSFDESF
jgi:ribonucleoside-diphosphate reductase beta chain